MANSYFFQFRYSKERMVVDLYAKADIGSSGAATLVTNSAKGIASLVRGGSAGLYTLTLNDSYNRLLGMNVMFIASGGQAAAPIVNVVSEDVAGDKTIVFQCSDDAGAATDPASGEVMMVEIALANVA